MESPEDNGSFPDPPYVERDFEYLGIDLSWRARISRFGRKIRRRLWRRFTKFPEEIRYLHYYQDVAKYCAEYSDEIMLREDDFGYRSLRRLAKVAEHLDSVAGCVWGCRSEDHVIEHIVARAVNQIQAALLLLRHGFYDESLVMTRGLSETANLLFLLANDTAERKAWLSSTPSQRSRHFGPARVRGKIESLDLPIPVDRETYSDLSELFAHPAPAVRPGMYNELGRPMSAALQPMGMILALNELSVPAAWTLASVVPLLHFRGTPLGHELVESSIDLLKSIGSVGLKNSNLDIGEDDASYDVQVQPSSD